jgi:hypothetical protein
MPPRRHHLARDRVYRALAAVILASLAVALLVRPRSAAQWESTLSMTVVAAVGFAAEAGWRIIRPLPRDDGAP